MQLSCIKFPAFFFPLTFSPTYIILAITIATLSHTIITLAPTPYLLQAFQIIILPVFYAIPSTFKSVSANH
jgi:hypothetical protein